MRRHEQPVSSLRDTLDWLRPLARRAGVSRVAEVTMMDYVGLPVFQAVRPRSRNLVVSQGKGLTREQAEISALMESIEMFHAETPPTHARASFADMQDELSYDVRDLVHLDTPFPEALVVDWVEADDIGAGGTEYVPRDFVSMDFTMRGAVYGSPFRRTSNGLGSGRDRTQAVLHGLYEVLERDCLSLATARVVELDEVSPTLAGLRDQLADCDIALEVRYLPNRFELPCFRVSIVEDRTSVRFWGSACDSDREAAIVKALTEAVQSRLTLICGGRDDIDESIYYKFDAAGAPPPLDTEPAIPLTDVPERRFATRADELDWLVALLTSRFDLQLLSVDLTQRELGIPVFFTIVPALTFTIRGH